MAAESGQMLSHYRLVEKIGEGGMGVVWKADDTVLDRTVAIKVLPAHFAPDESRREMFLKEAKLAASVSHGNIVQVHELGREGDLDFIVMEYVEGKPLSKILHGRPLPPEKVAELGLQIAQGLARAHRKKLIHRDLKPPNILVTPDGEAKIVDFGLAALFATPDTTMGSMATTVTELADDEQNAIAGTLPYMSPEQVSGERLDARSDIFSFGSVLYEMTTGLRPFRGVRPNDIAHEILKGQPTPVHDLVPSVPLDLDRVIDKALARRAVDRYQHADDIVVDLKRLGKELESGDSPSYRDLPDRVRDEPEAAPPRAPWLIRALFVIVPILLIVAAIFAWRWRESRFSGVDVSDRSIFLVPLETEQDPGLELHAGRLFSQALAIDLASEGSLRVFPVSAKAAGTAEAAVALAENVAGGMPSMVLYGSLIRSGFKTTVSLTLFDTRGDRVVWGMLEEVEGAGQLSTLASRTVAGILSSLGIQRSSQYDYFRNIWPSEAIAEWPHLQATIKALRDHDIKEGLPLTEKLLKLHPQDYQAHRMRVVALNDAMGALQSAEARLALEHGLNALEALDARDPYPAILGGWLLRGIEPEQSFEMTEPLLDRTDLTPACKAHVYREQSMNLLALERAEEALILMEQAMELDPANSWNYVYSARVLRGLGRTDESLLRFRQAVASDPYHTWELAWAYKILERWEDAAVAYAWVCEQVDILQPCADYARTLQISGQEDKARDVALEASKMEQSCAGSYSLACYWALAGDLDRAIDQLRRVAQLGCSLDGIMEDAELRSLQDLPEFKELVASNADESP